MDLFMSFTVEKMFTVLKKLCFQLQIDRETACHENLSSKYGQDGQPRQRLEIRILLCLLIPKKEIFMGNEAGGGAGKESADLAELFNLCYTSFFDRTKNLFFSSRALWDVCQRTSTANPNTSSTVYRAAFHFMSVFDTCSLLPCPSSLPPLHYIIPPPAPP